MKQSIPTGMRKNDKPTPTGHYTTVDNQHQQDMEHMTNKSNTNKTGDMTNQNQQVRGHMKHQHQQDKGTSDNLTTTGHGK